MSELLPCPFCGHDDQLYPAHHFPGTGPAYAIDCLRCGMDFTPREGMDVAAAWNRRASQAEIERLRTALTDLSEWLKTNKRSVLASMSQRETDGLAAALHAASVALSGSKE